MEKERTFDEQDDDSMDTNEYQDYKDIVIEIDEKILKFITSFKIGSILSLEVLVGLADKYECENCGQCFTARIYTMSTVKHT